MTGHDLVKAARACSAVERIARAVGMSADDAAIMRSLCLLLEAAVYTWDDQVEEEQANRTAPRRSPSSEVLLRLLEDLGCDTPAARADVRGLHELFAAESSALSASPTQTAWDTVTRLRPSDLRLQMRVILLCAGHTEQTADAVVAALSPTLVALEIVDDVRSVHEDRRSGGYNSYLYLREWLPADEARAQLEEVGRRLDHEVLDALSTLEEPAFSCALAIVIGAVGPVASRLVRLAERAPRQVIVGLLRSSVRGEDHGTTGELRRLWPLVEEAPAEEDTPRG
ncbi:hypothetical protein [Micrococcus luteus]|uniref:hypothetical protein n=1 Tax=Micrococcus luteus TaxID=1270 RepID=UPI0015D6CF29|nr:hypothetical protein [Micrococcus luteus]